MRFGCNRCGFQGELELGDVEAGWVKLVGYNGDPDVFCPSCRSEMVLLQLPESESNQGKETP